MKFSEGPVDLSTAEGLQNEVKEQVFDLTEKSDVNNFAKRKINLETSKSYPAVAI